MSGNGNGKSERAWAEFNTHLSKDDQTYFTKTDNGKSYASRSGNRSREVLFVEMDWQPAEAGVWQDSDTPSFVRETRIEFVDRYLERLPEEKRDLIYNHVGSMESFAKIAFDLGGYNKTTSFRRFNAAIRDLVREIALDDPDFEDGDDRDYRAEMESASKVAAKAGVFSWEIV